MKINCFHFNYWFMRITLVLFICFMMLLNVLAADSAKAQLLHLNIKNASLYTVFDEIRSQSGFDFVLSKKLIDKTRPVTLALHDVTLQEALQQCLAKQPLAFEIREKDKIVIIKEKLIAQGIDLSASQEITAKGKVTDSAGNALAQASVIIKGTTRGTRTDSDGQFLLEDIPQNALLIISYIGYKSAEVPATTSFMNILLQADVSTLDAAVVVGYGTSSKRKINSAVSTLDMQKVAALPVQSVNDGIAGRTQGVIVTSSSGAPGAKSAVSIRGGGTPLYVIDNIIRSENDFLNINPKDIDSYSVLKDASATALYGARGGNGVILVTTKGGQKDRVVLDYAFNQTLSQPTTFPKRLSSYDNLLAINQVYEAEGLQKPTPDDILAHYRTQDQPFIYPNTDWQDIALKRFAPEQRHDLSLSSGNDLLTYYASGSYYYQGTNLKTDNSYNKRATYRLNAQSHFDNIHLKVNTSVDGYVETNSVPSSATASDYVGIYQHLQQRKSNELAYNEFGLPSSNTVNNTAVELSDESGYKRGTSRVFNGIVGMEYEAPFLPGLSLKLNGNYNMWNSMDKSWNLSAPTYANNSTSPIQGNPPTLNGVRGDGTTFLLQGYVKYNRSFGDHSVDFTGVYEQAKVTSNSLTASRQQYQIIYDQFVAGPTINQLADGSESENGRAGYVGRLSYNYKSRYFLDASIRYDGLDYFPKGKQWGTFYSFSGGYALSEEAFMKDLNERNILNYAKLRGSFGLVGTADNISPFQYVAGYNVNANTWVIDGRPVQGTSEPGNLPSTNFSWYSIHERNVGLDLASLNNRLSATVDYFYKRTTGYVGPDTRYAAPLGIGLPPINFKEAAQRRHGAEFNINWKDNWNDLSYAIGVNFTYYNELWERTTNEDAAALKNPYTRTSGTVQQALTTGYINEGFYQNNSDLLYGARPISSISVVAGDLAYEDFNGDGKIDASDQVRIGNPSFPRINYGTTVDLGYKGWSLSAVVMGSGSRDRYLGALIQGSSLQNMLIYDFQRDYWRPDHRDALFPRQVSNGGVNGGNNYVSSDFWIMKSQFIRLKYVQVGYDITSETLKRLPFKHCRIFLSGTNLLTSSKSLDYFIDPESNPENSDYPIQRTFSLGVNVGF